MSREFSSSPLVARPSPTPDPPADAACQGRFGFGALPWFWISGVLMFLGCFLLNAAAHQRKDELLPVLGLVFVFNVYELAVLSLAAWLRRNGAEGESRRLAWLAVILLADTTFVYNTLAVVGPGVGSTVAALALAALKLAFVLRVCGIRLRRGEWVAAALALASVFGLPVVARIVGHSGFLGVGFLHAAAWWVGAVLAVGLWAWDRANANAAEPTPNQRLRLAVLGVPLLSLAAHAVVLPWMYGLQRVDGLELVSLAAPFLLGSSVVLLVRSRPGWTGRRAWAAVAGVGAVLTAEASRLVLMPDAWPAHIALTPVRAVLLAGALAYAWLGLRQRSWVLWFAWPAMLLVALLGPSLTLVWTRLIAVVEGVGPALRAMIPRTLTQWGTVAVAAAFAVLALGAWSARRRLPRRASL